MIETNPIVVRLHRGDAVESVHRGAWALCRPDGSLVASAGDPAQKIFGRSATKSLQALALIEQGGADHFGLDDAAIAVTLASHNGEDQHVDVVRKTLATLELDEQALRCGPQAPKWADDGWEAVKVRNNCSGKHSGFLALACHLGEDPSSYLDRDGRTQQLIRSTVAEMGGVDPDELGVATDGCSAPTFQMPLSALATAIARVTNPDGLAPERAAACRRITSAAAKFPELVAGRKRLDSALLAVTDGRIFPKIGAEAVYVAGLVGQDLGLALKIDDGKEDIARVVAVNLLHRLGALSDDEYAALDQWGSLTRRNWDGLEIGQVELSDELTTPLTQVPPLLSH